MIPVTRMVRYHVRANREGKDGMTSREGIGAGPNRGVRVLRSLRLTIPLLCILAALFIAGTFAGPRLEKAAPALQRTGRILGLLDPWRSPAFLLAGGLLVANILLCTWHRFRMRSRTPAGGRNVVPWLDAAVHFSLVVMIAGGIGKGLWGAVGTGYLFPGTPATTMYREGPGADVPLGFAVRLEEKLETYYPLRVKVGVRDAASGDKVALLEVFEGREVSLTDGRLTLSVREVRQNPDAVTLLVRTPEGESVVTLSLVEGAGAVPAGPFRLAAAAWRRDVKDVRGRVIILEGERVVREGWLEVNGALSHRGTSIFLTAWGADEFGNQFLGVQYRSDPAAFVFWAGAILFALALPPFVLLRRRRAIRQPAAPGGAAGN